MSMKEGDTTEVTSNCVEVEIETSEREIQPDPLCDHNYWKTQRTTKARKPTKKIQIRSLTVLYYCKICRFSTMNKQTITTHRQIHKQLKPDALYEPCSDCNLNKTGLTAPNNSLKCPHCTYYTHNEQGLKLHMNIHLKERPFKCNDCNYFARNIKELVSHTKLGHSNLKELNCDVCYYSTKYKDRLIAHKRSHKAKSFICHICSYMCRQLCNLQVHLKRHGAEGDCETEYNKGS